METQHDILAQQYAEELQNAKLAAELWWKELLASETKKRGGVKEATASIKRRWPLGPASHPYVVAILRKYWLACEALNEEIVANADNSGDDEVVSPPIFLCDFLLDGKHEKLAAFIAPLNYWPIGMEDDEGVKA
jgi:hypothetical protein